VAKVLSVERGGSDGGDRCRRWQRRPVCDDIESDNEETAGGDFNVFG
jgi:hypothetical protein